MRPAINTPANSRKKNSFCLEKVNVTYVKVIPRFLRMDSDLLRRHLRVYVEWDNSMTFLAVCHLACALMECQLRDYVTMILHMAIITFLRCLN